MIAWPNRLRVVWICLPLFSPNVPVAMSEHSRSALYCVAGMVTVDETLWHWNINGQQEDLSILLNSTMDVLAIRGGLAYNPTQQLAERITDNGIFIGGDEQNFYRLKRYTEKHYARDKR